MPVPVSPETCIQTLFARLDKKHGSSFPEPGSLANTLNGLLASARNNNSTIKIAPSSSCLFASAAVEMWLRSVHSFLVSVSVMETSQIWSSVTGYYASHYSVRGLAHLLGFFLLHKQKHIASIELISGQYYCTFEKSKNQNREHVFYWKTIKTHPLFKDELIFTLNDETSKQSDAAHRNLASYYDHVNKFQVFKALDEEVITRRIDYLSKVEVSSVPFPRLERYPDLDNVHLIAYHRIVKFRNFLNEILGDDSNFWKIHRNPSWCPNVINYQLVEPNYMPTV